jgi:uncharacterized membrane protein
MIEKTLIVIFTHLIPTAEQVGGIPIALHFGFSPPIILLVSSIVSFILFLLVRVALDLFHSKFISKIKIVQKWIENVRKRGKLYVEKYGTIGLILFILVPSPFTGIYSATVLTWLFGFSWKKSVIAILLGSFFRGLLILFVSMGMFSIFL